MLSWKDEGLLLGCEQFAIYFQFTILLSLIPFAVTKFVAIVEPESIPWYVILLGTILAALSIAIVSFTLTHTIKWIAFFICKPIATLIERTTK